MMAEFYNANPDLTAVVESNDLLAFGAMSYLEDQGLHIPENVSVVGSDVSPTAP